MSAAQLRGNDSKRGAGGIIASHGARPVHLTIGVAGGIVASDATMPWQAMPPSPTNGRGGASAAERRGNDLKRLKDLYLKAFEGLLPGVAGGIVASDDCGERAEAACRAQQALQIRWYASRPDSTRQRALSSCVHAPRRVASRTCGGSKLNEPLEYAAEMRALPPLFIGCLNK